MKNPIVHLELSTDDPAKATKFYKGLFSWKTEDVDMGPMVYTMIDMGSKDSGGGIQCKPMPGMPTAWLAYVKVGDVKKTIAKAKKLGACIEVAYQPIPGMGAFGVFTDPTGGTLAVWEPGKKAPRKAAKKKKSRR